MNDREKEYIKIQEKNDHYILYVAVGGLYLSFFIYDKISTHFFKAFFILGLIAFVFSVIIFLISRHYSKNVAEEEARKKEEKDDSKINKWNCIIMEIDFANTCLVIMGCILNLLFFIFNLVIC